MAESNAQRVAKNTGFLFIRMVLVTLVSLYLSRVVLEVLGFEDYGIYNVVGSVVVFLAFLQTALNNATYRYLAYELGRGDTEKLKKVYSMAINSHVLLALIVLIVMEFAGVWFLNTHLNIPNHRIVAANWTFQISILTFCVSIIRTPFNSNIIVHEHMNFYALISIVEVLLKLTVVYMLSHSPIDKMISYAALMLVVALVVLVIYVVYCTKIFKDTKYIHYWDTSMLKQLTSYSGWSLLVNVADVSTVQCISIFFFNLLGAVANASLGIANQVNGALTAFLNTFTQAFNPQIIKHYAAGRMESFMTMVYSTSKISYVLLFLISFPVVVNIEFVLSLWLGNYPPMTPAFIQIIIIVSLVDSFQAPLWQAVHATGKIKTHQILMASIKFTNIPLMYLILRLYSNGVLALCVWVLTISTCAIVRTIYMKGHIGLDLKLYFNKVVMPLVFLTILALPIPLYIVHIMNSGFIAAIISSTCSVIITSTLAYFIVLNKAERELLLSMPFFNKFSRK